MAVVEVVALFLVDVDDVTKALDEWIDLLLAMDSFLLGLAYLEFE